MMNDQELEKLCDADLTLLARKCLAIKIKRIYNIKIIDEKSGVLN